MDDCDGKIRLDRLSIEGSRDTQMENRINSGTLLNYQFRSMSVLQILRETVRILRYNCAGFMGIAALLICPVSAVQLSNMLVDHTIVRRLSIRLLLIGRASGLPLSPVVKQSCQKFSEMAVSTAVCFFLYITLSLVSKAAVVYSVDCTYSKKQFNVSKFCVIVSKLWRRVVVTYVWACMVIVGVVTLFLIILVAVCNVLLIFGFIPDLVVYPGVVIGLIFSVVFANVIILCNVAVVISVLEDASGPQALLRSFVLIRGQTQVGLLMYLVSTMGMAFVQGLFEHRVKTLSYGDGSSRIWEGPLLVIMYSFVVLIDYMMTAVFYFSCRSYSMEAANEEAQSILELATATPKANSVDTENQAS
ncbi:hypothetical protein SOVF_007750 [Spinacia oleracea]|uniref:Uncharacterized protein n=1 Tax=Spinacia oleracea TaxID=3562 RepID=A0ABM3QWH8_SPIOL|nr:uncharacterized protein LOC110785040 [Spinacia oleracea]KNA25313.1 hypothetical protein SOVF_007750 [Spinacia oleracea]